MTSKDIGHRKKLGTVMYRSSFLIFFLLIFRCAPDKACGIPSEREREELCLCLRERECVGFGLKDEREKESNFADVNFSFFDGRVYI